MNPADIAALMYALVVLGEAAARGIRQMKGDGLSDEEFAKAWEAMQQRLSHANTLWQHASGARTAAAANPEQGSAGV